MGGVPRNSTGSGRLHAGLGHPSTGICRRGGADENRLGCVVRTVGACALNARPRVLCRLRRRPYLEVSMRPVGPATADASSITRRHARTAPVRRGTRRDGFGLKLMENLL